MNLSRAVLLVAALLIMPGAVPAQSVSVGALGGFNLVNYPGPTVGGGWQPALRAGGTVMVALGPKLELAGEVAFAQLGTHMLTLNQVPGVVGGNPVVIETRTSVRLSHIETPLLLSAVLPVTPDRRITVRLGGGPSVAYRARCSAVTRIRTIDGTGGVLASNSTEDACGDTVRTVDLGLAANGGARFELGWGDLFADLRYRLGLVSPVSGSDGRFKQLSVAAGVAFGL